MLCVTEDVDFCEGAFRFFAIQGEFTLLLFFIFVLNFNNVILFFLLKFAF
jgi:hypothetical protein